jgi:hypothetical protein
MPNAVTYKGRIVNVGTIPIGIDPEKFADVLPPLQTSLLACSGFLFPFVAVLNLVRNWIIRNASNESPNSKTNSRGRKLLLASIGSITSKVSLKNYMPLKSSSPNIPNGVERSPTQRTPPLFRLPTTLSISQ